MDYQLISNFKRAIPPLQEIERNSNAIAPLQSQINELKNDSCPTHGMFRYYLISFFIADVCVFFPILSITENGIIALIAGLIFTVIIGTFLYNIRKSKDEKRIAEHKEMTANKISKLNQEILAYTNEISRIYNENQNMFMSIPPDYREAWKVAHLCSILENQRADTLKEALNVFEEDMHRRAMQAGQQQIINQQMQLKQRVRYAEEMAYQAQQTAEQAYYHN